MNNYYSILISAAYLCVVFVSTVISMRKRAKAIIDRSAPHSRYN
jgi:hypothetical protein